jgi:hypothetical protein
MAQTRTNRRFQQMEEAHEALANDVQQNIVVSIRTLQSRCAWKSEVTEEFRVLSGRVKHCETFVDEIENGSGARVQKFVRGYVESFVPRWYETVSGPLWVKVTSAIAKASDDTSKKAQSSLLLAEDRQTKLVATLRDDHDGRMRVLDGKHSTALAAHAEDTKDRFANFHDMLEGVAGAIRGEASQALAATHDRFCMVERAAHALRATLCLDGDQCQSLMDGALCNVVGGDRNRTSGVFGPNDDLLLSDDGEHPSTKPPASPRAAPARKQAASGTGALERSGSASNFARQAVGRPGSGGQSFRKTRSRSGSEPADVGQSTMAEDLQAFVPVPRPGTTEALAPTCDDLPIGRILAEPRVLAILRAPYFTAIRAIMQDEIEARASETRRELQRDLSQQLLDIQAELKTKVNVRRLAEFLQENRDETLYGNVRTLLADVQDMKMHKVDLTTFHEVLRQKADTKTLDLKADKQQVSNNIAMLTGRVDNVEHEAAKHQEKVVDTELRLSELIYWLHTGRTMGDSSTRLVSSHAHSELLKLRPTKHGMKDRHAKQPDSVVVDGSRREIPPAIERIPGFGPAAAHEDTETALVPSIDAASPQRAGRSAVPPTARSPLRQRSSPKRSQLDPTPPSSGRHAHHPQKRVIDGSQRDHLTQRQGSTVKSGHHGPLPPTMAAYVQLLADHPEAEVDASRAASRVMSAPHMDPDYALSATVKAERIIPDGPAPRSGTSARDERVSWTPEATGPAQDGAVARTHVPKEAPAAAPEPAVRESEPISPLRTRPPSGKSKRASVTEQPLADDAGLKPSEHRSASSATDDPRVNLGAWSAASAGSSQSALGQHATARSPDQPVDVQLEAESDPPPPAAEESHAESKRKALLGSSVKSVLLKSGAVTKDQLRKNDPLNERPRHVQRR